MKINHEIHQQVLRVTKWTMGQGFL